jgi:phage replication O-like protein O
MNEKPGLKKGFTQISNETLKEIFIKGLLSQTEIRIALYIIRESAGFHKDWTNKCSVQKIADDIGLRRPFCSKTINQMIRENKIMREDNRFRFNENYKEWIVSSNSNAQIVSRNLNGDCPVTGTVVFSKWNGEDSNNTGQINASDNPKYTLNKILNKEERNIKERKLISGIFFNKTTFKFENIPKEKLKKWIEAFPLINIEVEIKKMEAWLAANPKRKKVNYERFIVNWLGRARKGEKTNGKYIALSYKDTGTDFREKQGGNGEPIPPGEW